MSGQGQYQIAQFVPKMDDEKDYLNFKKEVKLWEAMTNMKEEQRAPNIAFRLPKKAKSVVLDMDINELSKGVTREVNGNNVQISGVTRLLEILDSIYLEDLHREKFKAYCEFRNCKRKESQSVHDFLLAYDCKKRHLEQHGIQLPPEIYAFELLASVNLTKEQEALANCTVQDLTYDSMKEQVKKIVLRTNSSEETKPIISVSKENHPLYMQQEENSESSSQTGLEFEDSSSVENDTYYSNRSNYRGRGRYRGTQNRHRTGRSFSQLGRYNRGSNMTGGQASRTNPRDQYGNILTCHVCGSINHFARECPQNKQYYTASKPEHVTLFQKGNTKYSEDSMNKLTGDNLCLAVLDSGCNITVCGKDWLKVYLESLSEKDMKKVKVEESCTTFKFGDNKPTVSYQKYHLPATVCNKEVNILTEVVEDNIPLLISKKSMVDAKMILDFGENTVTAFGHTQKLLCSPSGHTSIPLKNVSVHNDVCFCTQSNVVLHSLNFKDSDKKRVATKLHKQFGHPRPKQLKELIKTAGKEDKELFKEIDEIEKRCEVCKRYKQPELRPIVSMPLARKFNDTVSMDLKCYDAKKGIYFQHLIDHLTRFSMAKVIMSKNKEVLIESIFTHWISVFGRPKKFMSDNGGEYSNENFLDMCEKLGVHVVTTGAESAWSNGLVERHHALLARNVSKIIEDTGCRVETALAWAVNAKNILSNVGGFSPYQMVLGQNPEVPTLDNPYENPTVLEHESPSERVAEHISAMYSARKHQMEKDADEKIRRALAHKTRDVMSKEVVQGDKVYYKRDNDNRWKGPATVIGTDRKIIFLRHGGYQIKCHITRVVKVNEIYEENTDTVTDPPPQTIPQNTDERGFEQARQLMTAEDVPVNDVETEITEHVQPQQENVGGENVSKVINQNQASETARLCDEKVRTEKKKLVISVTKHDPFAKEKEEEMQKWITNDVYEEVSIDDLSTDKEINPIAVGWIFTDTEKKRKARLVAKGFQEAPLSSTATVSPTCRKESMRILCSLAASMKWTVQSIDITSAFLQGKAIDRDVYLIPPPECSKKGVIWKLKKCVYGLSDAARMWYNMVKETIAASGIQKCPHDDSLFYLMKEGKLTGIMAIHVDDFMFSGNSQFLELLENGIMKQFIVGSWLKENFSFLGLQVQQNPDDKVVYLSQHKYILEEVHIIQLTQRRKAQKNYALAPDEYKKFKSLIGKVLWLSTQTRPDIAYDVCQLSNHLSDPNVADILTLNKMVKKLRSEHEIQMVYNPINLSSMKLIVFSDSAYGNLPKNGSQCGYIIFLTDESEKYKNPVAWKSVKIERVCRSALAAEGLGMVNAIDHAMFVMETLQKMMDTDRKIPIVCYTDNKSLSEVLQKTKDPEEKRLICALAPIRDSIERNEIVVKLIKSKEMPADILTKRGVNSCVLRHHLEC